MKTRDGTYFARRLQSIAAERSGSPDRYAEFTISRSPAERGDTHGEGGGGCDWRKGLNGYMNGRHTGGRYARPGAPQRFS